MVNEEAVLDVLNNLLRVEDVLACMVSQKGLGGISPPVDSFKIKDISIWSVLEVITDPFFDIIGQFAEYDLNKVYFELGGYTVMFFLLVSDVVLIVIIPTLANRGLLEVEVENARQSILKVL